MDRCCHRPPARGGILLLLTGLACFVVGCNPQALSMLVMGFSDNKVDLDYKLFAEPKKEVKLVIPSNFAQEGIQLREESSVGRHGTGRPARCAIISGKRCEENKHKLKIVPQTEVRNFHLKEMSTGELSDPIEIGKHFKASYVLDLSIQSLKLYEPNSYPKMFRGNIQIAIECCTRSMPRKAIRRCSTNPISASNIPPHAARSTRGSMNLAFFRGPYLNKVAR